MTSQNSLVWQETLPGRYERQLDSAELFYTVITKTWEATGHTMFAISASVDFTMQQDENTDDGMPVDRVVAAFQHAWKQSRLHFPTIAAEVIHDPTNKSCKKVYNVPADEKEVGDWMAETFFVVEDVVSVKEFANRDPPAGRFATLHLFIAPLDSSSSMEDSRKGSKRMSLIFRCKHDIIDGLGTLKILNHILDFAAAAFAAVANTPAIVYGDEHKNLSPPLEIAYGTRAPPTEAQLSNLNATRAANDEARNRVHVIGFPGEITTFTPGRSLQASTTLSAQETTRVVKSCKSVGVTVTHLFHAALALALGSLQDQSDVERKVQYSSYALINLRGICNQSSDVDRHPDSVLHSGSARNLFVDLTVPAKSEEGSIPETGKYRPQELLKTLYTVRDFYRGNIIDAEFISLIPTLFRFLTPPYPDTPRAMVEPETPRNVSLSSLGLIDKIISRQHGPFTVSNPWITAGEYSPGMGLFLGAFNGELILNSAYNEAFYEESTVLNLLHRVKEFAMDIAEAIDHEKPHLATA